MKLKSTYLSAWTVFFTLVNYFWCLYLATKASVFIILVTLQSKVYYSNNSIDSLLFISVTNNRLLIKMFLIIDYWLKCYETTNVGLLVRRRAIPYCACPEGPIKKSICHQFSSFANCSCVGLVIFLLNFGFLYLQVHGLLSVEHRVQLLFSDQNPLSSRQKNWQELLPGVSFSCQYNYILYFTQLYCVFDRSLSFP